jgi:hypothetical protein
VADRAVRQARHDSDGDTLAIGSPNEYWSPRLKDDAINDILNGLHTYHVPWVSGRTEIRVVDGQNGPYLRTDRDSTSRNNLDDLPEC